MLTSLTIRNFKRFESARIELANAVVFVGPNNSGKTTALQALVLWETALRTWGAKRSGKASPEKRPGVAINRRDLVAVPVPAANLLWNSLHTRTSERANGKSRTQNVRIDVIVEGIGPNGGWTCGFEFDYQNEEAFVCRPVRLDGYEDVAVKDARFSEVPADAEKVNVAYLPPMSGLADREFFKQPGEIGFLIGQGQTAHVLRNLCFAVSQKQNGAWEEIATRIQQLFGVTLNPPVYISERSEITMDYQEKNATLDLSSAGRGLQQTLLLLAHLYANPGSVLLLDEPDAHLEILRQRQTYKLITDVARRQGSQIFAASHSEVVLAEAAGTDRVVAFVGRPHVMNDRTGQVIKSLTEIGWDQYYQAEATGCILFLEGPTDLSILQAIARKVKHPVANWLERPFVHYVSNNLPQNARNLFHGLKEAKPDLVGFALFDKLERELQSGGALVETMWTRREIENYVCNERVLLAFAKGNPKYDLFAHEESQRRIIAMTASIAEMTQALETIGKPSPWSSEIKVTDDFLDPLFKLFYKKLEQPLSLRKSDYHELAELLAESEIDSEILEKLDALYDVTNRATPANG